MKSKLMKVWGVVLVLAVLAALLVPAAVPASAAVLDMTWSSQGAPSAMPFNVLVPGAAPAGWLIDVAPDGKTMFAWNNTVVTAIGSPPVNYTGALYKSTNGGLTWSKGAAGAPNQPLAGGDIVTGLTMVDLKISSDYANDSTVILATATTVYRSGNGGVSFFTFGTAGVAGAPLGLGNITSVDVGADYNGGQAIVVGTSTGTAGGAAYRYAPSTPIWTNLGFPAADVYGVALSPNYRTDAQVLVFASDAGGSYLWNKVAGNPVNTDVLPATLATIANAATTKVAFAFPADYAWANPAQNYIFVGVGDTAAVVAGNDVWRVRGALPGGSSQATDLNLDGSGTNSNISSLAFKGNLTDGTLYVGLANNTTIWKATGVSASSITFVPSTKNPTGAGNTVVMASSLAEDNTIWVLTGGAGSAFSTSSDNAQNFSQISLINVSSMANFKIVDFAIVDADTMYLLTWDDNDGSGAYNGTELTTLFKTTNSGANWQGVYVSATNMNRIYVSPGYAAATPDNTIFITEAGNRIWKSSNAGVSFVGYSAGSITAITAFTPIDANTYFIGGANAVSKGGFAAPATINGETPLSIKYVSATDMFIGTAEGSVYRSLNGGVSFIPVGAPRAIGSAVNQVITDTGYDTNKIIFAGTANGVYKWTIDTSTSWTPAMKAGTVAYMSQVPDGTIYVTDITDNGTTGAGAGFTATGSQINPAQILRCASPASPGPSTWDTMIPYPANTVTDTTGPVTLNFPAIPGLSGFTNVSADNTVAMVKTIAVPTGSAQVPNNTIYCAVNVTAGPTAGPSIYSVKDTVVVVPAITAPAANGQVASNSNFTWAAVATAFPGVKYDVQVAYDAAFANPIINTTQTGTLLVPAANTLQQGQTYYWRVRVGAGNPLASKWSPATKFSVQLSNPTYDITGGGLRLQPAAGATNVPLKPVFQWAAITGAQSYDLQVSDNPVFVNPLDAQTGLNTNVWTFTKELENGKTYYWRVRAVSASGVASEWVSSAFTTATEAVDEPGDPGTAPVITITQPAAPIITITQPAAPVITITQAGDSDAPTTPVSVWVLIVIGAVLIIAVIVLIVRTRRV